MRRKLAFGAGALLFAATWSGHAAAFCRTTTCDTCDQPAGACVTEGAALYWAMHCISYNVQQDGSKWATFEQVNAAATAAFDAWQNATCSASGAHPSIRLVNRGPVACDKHEFNDETHTYGGNANIIMFHDDGWPEAGPGVIALTTVSFGRTSGRIYDADIEINGLNTISVDDPVPSNAYDLQSIISHEAGHFLGLAHTNELCMDIGDKDCPTMSPRYPQGSDAFRTLAADDVGGICAVYAPGRAAGSDSCEPCNGFSSTCGTAEPVPGTKYVMTCGTVDPSGGCAMVAMGRRSPGGRSAEGASWPNREASTAFAGLVGLALFFMRRRRD
jgi:hypothetical protein